MSDDTVSTYWLQTLKLWRTVPLKCKNGHFFFEVNNLGQHKCWQHSEKYNSQEELWPCCKKRSFINPGCVPADHNVNPFMYSDAHDIEKVPSEVSKVLNSGPGVKRDNSGKIVYITRFNKEIHNENLVFTEDGYTLLYKE